MNWDAIAAIGELTAALAVICSLLYVVKELSQNNHNQRLAALQTHTEAFRENIAMAAQHAETWVAGLEHYPNLSPAENARFGFLIHASFRHLEQSYFLLQEGVLPEEVAMKNINMICRLCSYPGALSWWNSRKFGFDDGFAAVADDAIRREAGKPFYEFINPS